MGVVSLLVEVMTEGLVGRQWGMNNPATRDKGGHGMMTCCECGARTLQTHGGSRKCKDCFRKHNGPCKKEAEPATVAGESAGLEGAGAVKPKEEHPDSVLTGISALYFKDGDPAAGCNVTFLVSTLVDEIVSVALRQGEFDLQDLDNHKRFKATVSQIIDCVRAKDRAEIAALEAELKKEEQRFEAETEMLADAEAEIDRLRDRARGEIDG